MGFILSILIVNFYLKTCCYAENSKEITYKLPTVGISVLVRNKGHTLPYFLTCINNLDYPKDRLYLWIYSDYNEDNSVEILEKWHSIYTSKFKNVYITANTTNGPLHSDEKSTIHWSLEHFKHVIRLREEALDFARRKWVDYLFGWND